MSRKRRVTRRQKIVVGISAAALVGGIAIVTTGTSQASVACDGLATALSNNQKFIADQQAHPDAQSAARIANRQAVIKEIQVKQQAAGCTGGGGGEAAGAPPAAEQPPGSAEPSAAGDPSASAAPPAADGDVVCPGSTVTLSGEGGAPAASSNQFPTGTKLKVTNLDNNKSTTVSVTSASGSCVLLNNAAFEQVRETGKFLIRRARIERVG
ncbi:RlpA-like double-psi beta-barrel domain-containing protein [Streptomyces lydicus]|uniref:hypothetical protein n=1 Tax=Streptomyces lydicus TaxID=47763 RepID=UPI000524AD77|nr:hypothetical protein [Streptomyces lydicus]UEG95257.1 septal ring lytic transglycosylase RlpA family protein [Streptomyces lydicus]